LRDWGWYNIVVGIKKRSLGTMESQACPTLFIYQWYKTLTVHNFWKKIILVPTKILKTYLLCV
jgi:hypothetical protein